MAKVEPVLMKLYKGKVEIKFFPESHQYWVNGRRVTGVTSFLSIKDRSYPLMTWAVELFRDHLLSLETVTEADIFYGATLHLEKKKEAADLGTLIHDWCEAYIKYKIGILPTLPGMPEDPRVLTAVNGFLDWEKKHKVKFISSERVVYSRKHGYIGTLDIEAMVDGKLCLVDLKSSNSLQNTVNLQTAAYVEADQEERKVKYHGRWAIRLAKESEAEYLARMERKRKNNALRGATFREPAPYVSFEARELDTDIKDDFKTFLAAKRLYEWDKKNDYFLRGNKK